jgi:hypothetical protein
MEDSRVPRLLIVHHTPSPHCQELFEAVVAGATDPEIEGVEVVRRPALTVSPVEMLEADGYVLGSPANLGYLRGAMKQFSGVTYYDPDLAYGSYVLYADGVTRLIDLNGVVRNEWPYPGVPARIIDPALNGGRIGDIGFS